MVNNNSNYNSRIGVPKNIKFNSNEILDASHSVAAGLIQMKLILIIKIDLNIFTKIIKKFGKERNFSFLKQWVGDNF